MGYTVELLNAIRNGASTEYQARVPVATQTNITTVGQAITSYEPTMNEFATTLINKIGMTKVTSMMAENKLKRFKKGTLPLGKTIEEIWVEMAKAEGAFDKTGANPLGRRENEVLAMYHSENRRDKYVATVSEDQVKGAFNSSNGVHELVAAIINSIFSGAEYDEYLLMKNTLALYKDNYFNYGVEPITGEAGAKDFVKTVRKAVSDLSYVSDKYNKAGVMTRTRKEDMVLIVHKDVVAEVDVEVLSKAFNMGKTDFEPEIIEVDDFGSMTGTYGLLVDKDFFMIYDTLVKTKQQENVDGLFTNHFYHIWQILSTSQFKNAVRFTTDVVTP